MNGTHPNIILINGASSAGKSSLAKTFQAQVDVPFLRFSLDLLLFGGEILPVRRDKSGPFSWAVMRPKVFDGYYGCLTALASADNNMIIDSIIETPAQYDQLSHALAAFDVFYVKLYCPLPELERRERERGDRRIGDARRDFELVDDFGPYDIELNSIASVEANAAALIAAWNTRCSPGAFARNSG